MATRFEQVVAGLETLLKRPLADDERDQVAIWDKCRDLQSFISTFPREWEILKETLQSYISDYVDAWDDMKDTAPANRTRNLDILHGQVYAVNKVISSFIADVENAPSVAENIPDVIKDGFAQLQAMPKEAVEQ